MYVYIYLYCIFSSRMFYSFGLTQKGKRPRCAFWMTRQPCIFRESFTTDCLNFSTMACRIKWCHPSFMEVSYGGSPLKFMVYVFFNGNILTNPDKRRHALGVSPFLETSSSLNFESFQWQFKTPVKAWSLRFLWGAPGAPARRWSGVQMSRSFWTLDSSMKINAKC